MTEQQRPAPPHSGEWPKSEERFRLLVESVKDYGIFMLDPAGYIVSWNSGAEHLKGCTAAEAIGTHFSRFYPPEEIAAGKPQRELELAVAGGRVEDEGWRVRKDGTRFWADVVITALYDPASGELQGFGKVTRDLTERKRGEERLRRSEEQFRLLVESVEEYAIFMLDPTGHVATWNSGAEKSKGYAVEEIVGEHFERFYTPADREDGRPARLLEQARTKGQVRDQGLRVRKDGSTFHADVLITAIHGPGGKLVGFSKVTRDITDVLRQRELEAAREVAERANKAKDDFLAVLSHELRTPLTPVLAAASYLQENFAALTPEEVLTELDTIRRNALLEAQLIDDLLDLTRITRNKVDLRFEALDLHGVLRDALAILKEDIAGKELRVETMLNARSHWVWADPTRIRQVFWNLVNNAVKFTPTGGRITVRSFNPGDEEIVVEVSDTGIGIEPEQARRIFNAFEQGERTVTRQFGGLGLGLAISRNLVQMHGGAISVQSEGRGKGATFRVMLFSVPHDPTKNPAPAPQPATAMGSLRILLVDDHADTLRILAGLLRKDGHKVEIAESARAAQVRLQSGRVFDVLLSDIGLPDGSGHQVMQRAREVLPNIHGIALSGFGMQEDIGRSNEAGFQFHLVKPVDVAVLRDLLRAISRETADSPVE